MKKILFLLTLIYSYSFSVNLDYSNVIYSFSSYSGSGTAPSRPAAGCRDYSSNYTYPASYSKTCYGSGYFDDETNNYTYSVLVVTATVIGSRTSPDEEHTCSDNIVESVDGVYSCNPIAGDYNYTPNPDPLGGARCRDLFQKDGVAFTCNPNTNEASPIENSDGLTQDEDGNDVPNCSEGYDYVITQSGMTPGSGTNGMYNEYSCAAVTGTGDGSDGGGDTGTPIPTITTNPDGSKSWTLPDGTNLHLTTNGTLTTTYPDGSSTVSQVGTSYDPTTGSTGGSSGGMGTSGGSGTNGNTTNEDNTSSNNDTPVDETPVANSCNDSSLTLQEKMMCEMNAGIKKLNSEATPENSLNNLLKDLNKDNNTNLTAINTNIKDTKSLNENQLAELKKMTTELKKLNATTGTSQSTITQPITDNFTPDPNAANIDNPINNSIIDSFTGVYTDFNTNISSQVGTLNNLITSSQNTISQGFSFSMFQSEIVNCPKDFQLDLSSLGQGQKNMTIDFCQYTSQLKPFVYPILLITMSLGVIFFAFRFIGVLI